MRTRKLAVAGLVALLFSGLLSQAWAEKGDMQIRFGVLYSIPTDDLKEMRGTPPQEATTELDDGFGFQAGFEYLVTDLVGVEPAISSINHDVSDPDEPAEIDWLALTANVNFHVMRDGRVDLFVGPTVGYAFWGDLETELQDFPVDGEFLYGFNVGVDVPFGEGQWGFSGALNYLFSDLTPEGSSTDIGVSPIQLKVGVSYSF